MYHLLQGDACDHDGRPWEAGPWPWRPSEGGGAPQEDAGLFRGVWSWILIKEEEVDIQ